MGFNHVEAFISLHHLSSFMDIYSTEKKGWPFLRLHTTIKTCFTTRLFDHTLKACNDVNCTDCKLLCIRASAK